MAEHPNLESCPARKTADTFLDDAEKRERQRERESYPLPLSLSLSFVPLPWLLEVTFIDGKKTASTTKYSVWHI